MGEESSKVILEESSTKKVILEESSTKKVTLRTSDGEVFELEETVASQSQMIRFMMEDNCANDAIQLPTITARILVKVIEYCKKHAKVREGGCEASSSSSDQKDNKELKGWDKQFMSGMDINLVFDLIQAANYLDISGLLDLTCQYIADHIKHMTPEEVRKVFNIENDFAPEEEARIRKENEWAFD
ncbi:SKP1-like protein 1A [Magnolia sinica]|uniref:SKP1-like protein 1A n=1 Tax=Magnolia sinica TaxID=86752 RepID=UPI00265A97F2|nr:SKP1-like protein 1A [Magnolia sinica]